VSRRREEAPVMALCLLLHWVLRPNWAEIWTGTWVIGRLYQKAARARGWLGYPRIRTDDVKGLGDHGVADDACLRSVQSHAAVLPSINPRGSAE
jgi:hypothetical protein